MPFGEMTIILDDVASILGIPVMGQTVCYNERMAYEEAQALLVDALGVKLAEAHEELMQVWGQSVRLEWLSEMCAGVSDDDGDEMTDCAVRAYLLYLLRCTLFTDKSGTRVPIIFLTQLVDLKAVRSYAWGIAALAYLYRKLGLAARHEVKQIAGYLTLLEAWVYEHFECLAPTPNINYQSDQPRVTSDPYRDVRQYHPFNEVAYYCGCIKCMDVVEPYHSDMVLRQFGRVQTIPSLPLAPIRTTRGPTARDYHI
ncbi:serine/threonine-protein phosphatase 7 long form [Cinnamomum micranthum f. kanehirae]|uniref:Serine/threonine-protein phosphatase 7 long form n=1 Tax=Cinnamomum micranthum f. kanehirae TaxID=337451 RepID=A0A443Q2H5_9MAGN|nr:serine/threonine-protein phosphatase 7 long form [Cinnamomum micranthum f. kanehirae]